MEIQVIATTLLLSLGTWALYRLVMALRDPS